MLNCSDQLLNSRMQILIAVRQEQCCILMLPAIHSVNTEGAPDVAGLTFVHWIKSEDGFCKPVTISTSLGPVSAIPYPPIH